MSFSLAEVLPVLLPRAIAWAEERSSEILSEGNALSDEGLEIARTVGVSRPERIRISSVPELPLPDDPDLRYAALKTGLLGPGHQSNRLLSHECRHVYQYEHAGTIKDYLPEYLDQIVKFGYHDAPFEVDARNYERDDC
jgi:hypothetical protein